jgi:hypothetical protein
MKLTPRSVFALLFIAALLGACSQATPTSAYPPPVVVSETPNQAYPSPAPETPVPTVNAYPGPTTQPNQGGLALAEQAAVQEVASKYDLPADQIKIVSTEAMTWNNGCMGVEPPDVACTQAIVNGFIIRLEGNGQQFEIHTNQDGSSLVDATQQQPSFFFVVQTSSQSILVLNPNFPLGPTFNPAFNGFLPTGGSAAGVAYVMDNLSGKVLAVDVNGQQALSFVRNPTYALAVWPGNAQTQPWLAWGTQPTAADGATSLMIANPDGSNLQTLLTISPNTQNTVQLVPEFWSSDGKSLYYSQEPFGIGGYILFSGASNLYKIDVATQQVTDILPQGASNPNPCLDAISSDLIFVADHCQSGAITIRNLQTSSAVTLQPPSDFTGYRFLGSARFSPTGEQVAFALAKGDPNDEQGWLAVGSVSGGTATIIATSDPGFYYNVIGWLDNQTLLVQLYSIGNPKGANQVLAVSADGSMISTVIDGQFLAVIDNR